MGEKENSYDLQIEGLSNQFSDYSLDGLKDLLGFLKSEKINIKIEKLEFKIKSIDSDNDSLSESEKKLYEVLKNLENMDSQVEFLNILIEEVEKRRNTLLSKEIEEMSKEELKKALKYTQNNYSQIIGKVFKLGDKTINSLDSQKEINNFQEKLIKKIYGFEEDKNFNGSHICGYNGEIGNYVVKIEDFETIISQKETKVQDINSIELSNYFLYLAENGGLNEKVLLEKFSQNPDFLEDLVEIWKEGDDNQFYVKKIIEDYNSEKDLEIEKLEKEIFEIVKKPEGVDLAIEIGGKNQKIISLKNEKIDFSIFKNIKKVEVKTEEAEKLIENVNKKPVEFFENERGWITLISEKTKLEEVLSKVKVKLSNLPVKFLSNYIFHKNVEIRDEFDIDKIPNKILENNFKELWRKIDSKNSKYLIERALYLGITKKEIRESLGEYGENINLLKEGKLISDEEFGEIKNLNPKEIKNKENYEEISNYISKNISNPEVLEIAIKMIENGDYGYENVFLTLVNKPFQFSKKLLEKDFKNIKYLDKKVRSKKEFIDIFFLGFKSGGEGKEKFIQFINPGNVNRGLQIFKYLLGEKVNISQDSKKIKEKLLEEVKLGVKLLGDSSFGNILNNLDEIDGTLLEQEFEQLYKALREIFDEINFEVFVEMSEAKMNQKIREKGKSDEEKENERIEILEELLAIDGMTPDLEKDLKDLIVTMDTSIIKEKLGLFTEKLHRKGYSKEATTKISFSVINKIDEYKREKITIREKNILGEIHFKASDLEENEYINKDLKLDKQKFLRDINDFISRKKQELEKNGEKPKKDEEYAIEFIEDNFESENSKNCLDIWKLNRDLDGFNEIQNKKLEIISYGIHKAENPEYKGNIEDYFYDLETGKIQIDSEVEKTLYDLEIKRNQKLQKTHLISSEKSSLSNFTEFTSDSGIDYSYDLESGKASNGEETIILDEQDRKILGKNSKEREKTLEKMFNFYDILKDVGLTKLWDIKSQIFKSISNVKGIAFSEKRDYLSENEIKLFLNAILVSIGEKPIYSMFNLKDFISNMKLNNDYQFIGQGFKKDFLLEETSIEKKFFDKFIGINRSSFLGFKHSLFEESIKGKIF